MILKTQSDSKATFLKKTTSVVGEMYLYYTCICK